MGGQSGVINQAAQMVNQPQAQQPQYGQQAPMAGNGVISQAYNQAINQQPQQNIMGNGGFNQPSPSYANSGTPSYSIGGQQFGGPNSSMQQPIDGTPIDTRYNPQQREFYRQALGHPESTGFSNYKLMPQMGANGMYDRPMAGVPSRGFDPSVPMNGMPQQGMLPQGMFGQPNQFQGGQNSMQRMMQNYQNSGREIPQGMQRYFDNMSSRQNQGSQAKPQVTNQPQMNEQHRLAKALRGD